MNGDFTRRRTRSHCISRIAPFDPAAAFNNKHFEYRRAVLLLQCVKTPFALSGTAFTAALQLDVDCSGLVVEPALFVIRHRGLKHCSTKIFVYITQHPSQIHSEIEACIFPSKFSRGAAALLQPLKTGRDQPPPHAQILLLLLLLPRFQPRLLEVLFMP